MELLTGVFAGALSLLGVWLGSHLQGRGKRQDLAREHRALLRAKIEEMFEIVAIIRTGTGSYFRSNIEAGKFLDVHDSPTFVSYHRLQSLTAIYFPDGTAIVNNHREQLLKVIAPIMPGQFPTAAGFYDAVAVAASDEAFRFCVEFQNFLLTKCGGLGADPSQSADQSRRWFRLK